MKRRRGLRTVLIVVLGVPALVLGVAAGIVVFSALQARAHLESALPLAASIQSALLVGDSAQVERDAIAFTESTENAVAALDNPVWNAAERVPLLGENLRAISTTAQVANGIAEGAVLPAGDIDLEAFKPRFGRLDVDAVTETAPVIEVANTTLHSASDIMADIDTSALLGPIATSVEQLRNELKRVGEITSALSIASQILPSAMGADGPRNYLLMFPNNAELRSQGGNPTAFAILEISDGEISIRPEVGAVGGIPVFPSRIGDPDEETLELYPDLGLSMDSITRTPDFPTTAAMAKTAWENTFGLTVDGVLSVDPVALSYVLEATGPLPLDGGGELDATNVVDRVLSEVYEQYPDGASQDAYFTAISSLVFVAVSSGQGSFVDLVAAFARAAEEHRLMFWAADDEEQEVIELTPLTGSEIDEDVATAFDIYLNDHTRTKLGYYLDATLEVSANRCQTTDTLFSMSGTLTSSVPVGTTLPGALTSPIAPAGTILTRAEVYGPANARVTEVYVAGKRVSSPDDLQVGDRTVVTIDLPLDPGETVDFSVGFVGEGLDYPDLDVRTTPMVREIPLRIYDAYC